MRYLYRLHFFTCPKQDLNLGPSRIASFKDCKTTALATQPPWLDQYQRLYLFKTPHPIKTYLLGTRSTQSTRSTRCILGWSTRSTRSILDWSTLVWSIQSTRSIGSTSSLRFIRSTRSTRSDGLTVYLVNWTIYVGLVDAKSEEYIAVHTVIVITVILVVILVF